MIKRLKIAIAIFLLIVLMCAFGRTLFYFVHYALIASGGEASFIPMLMHGLRLDAAISGYLCIIPFLLLIGNVWTKSKAISWIWNIYFTLISFALALAFLTNIALYKYWGFPLDSTPLFYFLSSPKDAVASVEWWTVLLGVVGLCILTVLVAVPFIYIYRKCGKALNQKRVRLISTICLVLLSALLFIPIRGGFTVATNNVGSVYFSQNIRLNHAAVNPMFSFLESVSHEKDFASMYRFMDDEKAASLFLEMTYTALRPDSISSHRIENAEGTRIVIVIMESFSSYIMSEEGHVKGVTPTLDRLSHEGIYFKNFYANSFRTDRGLVSILSGYPAQPNMSLMKFPRKTNTLYSIARSLQADGFSTDYVYGGDANFTNMRSYLMATGFERIISEEDFPADQCKSKWGANDGDLFDKALQTIDSQWKPTTKNMMVIQTSSSHEPFDVPCQQFDDKILNAFYYADRELGRFVDQLKKRDDWSHTLLLITPDHLGCYPDPEDSYRLLRYHIPLIITGGAVKEREVVHTYGSQQDIAATLLSMLRLPHDEFSFSKDLFDTRAPHFAFFTYPDAVGMATPENQVMTDNLSGKTLFDIGEKKGMNQRKSQAYLQKLFDDIANR